jgi:putative endonuclease
MYFVYLIQCDDNYFYTGIAWNLEKRLKEHNLGKILFIKNRRPLKLVYKESFQKRKEAAKREKEIKGWRREKKERLIKGLKSLH